MARYSFHQEISHPGLNKYQVVKADSKWELEQKVQAKKAQWDEQWERKVASEQRAAERAKRAQDAQEAMRVAEERTAEAEDAQKLLDLILVSSISDNELEFSDLKDYSPFAIPAPSKPMPQQCPPEPLPTDERYNRKASLFTKLSKQKRSAFDAENKALFEADHRAWVAACGEVAKQNGKMDRQYADSVNQWNQEKKEYEIRQKASNDEVNQMQSDFLAAKPDAIARMTELAIDHIHVPLDYESNAAAEYNPEDQSLILDVFLPVLEDIPTLKSVSYIKSRNEFKESAYSASYLKN